MISEKSNGVAIIGVTVLNVETKQYAITNVSRDFSITVTNRQNQRISYLGYETYEYKIKPNENTLNIILNESSSSLNEVILTGYQTERKKNIKSEVAIV